MVLNCPAVLRLLVAVVEDAIWGGTHASFTDRGGERLGRK